MGSGRMVEGSVVKRTFKRIVAGYKSAGAWEGPKRRRWHATARRGRPAARDNAEAAWGRGGRARRPRPFGAPAAGVPRRRSINFSFNLGTLVERRHLAGQCQWQGEKPASGVSSCEYFEVPYLSGLRM